MALSIGYRYNFGVKKQIYLRDTVPKIGRKNYFLVGLGLGILEKGKVSNGPTFNSYNLNLQYNRATGHTNHLVAGLNLSYSDMAYKETLFKENNESNIQNRTLNSMYASVFIGDELIFNSIGVFIHVGFYVFQPYSTLNFMYQKVGVNYYFPEMGKSKWRLYSGINIKSHLNTAESLEFRSGIRF